MVTHTQNLCAAFNPSKVHTQQWTHTHTHTHTHTVNTLRHWGSIWGFGAVFKCTSVVFWLWRELCTFTAPQLQFLPVQDSNSQTFDYESNSLTIRPRLPYNKEKIFYHDIFTLIWLFFCWTQKKIFEECLGKTTLNFSKTHNLLTCSKKKVRFGITRGWENIKKCGWTMHLSEF